MEKRTCALCPKDLECSVLYFARSENIAAHENCLLYSSALVECEAHDPCNHDRSFDVEAVKKEIRRGRKLKCTFCGKRGATVGCDKKACAKNYHFFCAKNDHAVLHTGSEGIYKVFCQQHAPSGETQPAHFSRMERKRGKKKGLSTSIPEKFSEPMTVDKSTKEMKENGRNTDAIVKAAFLKKCKDAGLLNDLFEEILDRLDSIQERLMDETTSESGALWEAQVPFIHTDYEEIGTSLFDCRLFEDTFVNFQAALDNKIHQFEEKQQQMTEEIKLLQDLKQTLCSVQENRDLRSSSTSVSSLSS
ncbi:PHD finger protein 11 isoform 1-T2 [Glossophaga mutica]